LLNLELSFFSMLIHVHRKKERKSQRNSYSY
jgi:hypothetical protein